jgi:hypothetical protein
MISFMNKWGCDSHGLAAVPQARLQRERLVGGGALERERGVGSTAKSVRSRW